MGAVNVIVVDDKLGSILVVKVDTLERHGRLSHGPEAGVSKLLGRDVVREVILVERREEAGALLGRRSNTVAARGRCHVAKLRGHFQGRDQAHGISWERAPPAWRSSSCEPWTA
ncbi:hypothetical protein HYQ46_010260 [Verticillium longisporum]|nr:hypothetical protein HYQ46_010260 [Verticillium longisporum]